MRAEIIKSDTKINKRRPYVSIIFIETSVAKKFIMPVETIPQ